MAQRTDDKRHASSTGQAATEAGWLDVHFEALRPEYQQALNLVGIEPGWHVLDAGCGAGSFIPLIAEAVGPAGKVTAVDHAPDNIERVKQRLRRWTLPCPVDVLEISLESLPFADGTFDAVWLANVLMYFTPDTLAPLLIDLNRVVRPNGVVASKESDGRMIVFYPMPTTPDHYAPILYLDQLIPGAMDTRGLHHHFRRSGLTDATHRTVLIERWAPLSAADHTYIGTLLQSGAKLASRSLSLGAEATTFWQQQEDPESPEALVNHPEFAFAIGHVVTTGKVPENG